MGNTQLFTQAKDGDATIQYTALQYRQLLNALVSSEGILAPTALQVTPRAAGANMSVDVAAGPALVKCDIGPTANSYLEIEDTTVNVPIPAAPGSGTRTHLIVEQARDPQLDSQSSYTSGPICIADTGSGATLPASALLLATVAVSSGQASVVAGNITDQRPLAAFPGQLLGTNKSTSNTNSAATAGSEQIAGPNVTITLSAAAYVRVEYVFTGRATDAATYNIEGKLRRASGTSGPGTGGTLLYSVFAYPAGNTNTQCTLQLSYAEHLTAGTYTYGLSVQGNGGRAWKDGQTQPSILSVYHAGVG